MEKSKRAFLTIEEKTAIETLYSDRLKKFGVSPTTVGWSSTEQQELRFKVLSEIGIQSGDSVCDIGCGLGELYPYLNSQGVKVQYTGIDIAADLIETAKKRFPSLAFETRDILQNPIDEKYDWIFLSGALNYKIADNWSFTKAILTEMFSMAKKGVACNFLTSYVDFENAINYHHKPEEVFSFAKTLTKNVVLRHDYPLWEFTIYMRK